MMRDCCITFPLQCPSPPRCPCPPMSFVSEFQLSAFPRVPLKVQGRARRHRAGPAGALDPTEAGHCPQDFSQPPPNSSFSSLSHGAKMWGQLGAESTDFMLNFAARPLTARPSGWLSGLSDRSGWGWGALSSRVQSKQRKTGTHPVSPAHPTQMPVSAASATPASPGDPQALAPKIRQMSQP